MNCAVRFAPPNASRRRLLAGAAAALAWPGLLPTARAGTQIEEPLADAVRTALSAAVSDRAPPRPSFGDMEERLAYLRWLGTMSDRLRSSPRTQLPG